MFSYRTDELIRELEEANIEELPSWQEEPWLKGSLGIVLNEDNNVVIMGYNIHYDEQYGLMYGKEER